MTLCKKCVLDNISVEISNLMKTGYVTIVIILKKMFFPDGIPMRKGRRYFTKLLKKLKKLEKIMNMTV